MITHQGTVKLKTKRLTLRQLEFNDASCLFSHVLGSKAVTDTLTWGPYHSVLQLEDYIAITLLPSYRKKDFYFWGIEHNGEIMGVIALTQQLYGWSVGYAIGENWWGMGFATEALACILDFAFNHCSFHKVFGCCSVNNLASGRVMEKAGMIKEAILKKQYPEKSGGFSDLVIYGSLNPIYKKP